MAGNNRTPLFPTYTLPPGLVVARLVAGRSELVQGTFPRPRACVYGGNRGVRVSLALFYQANIYDHLSSL